MGRVLLTGGRAPATLDLARKLRAAGHTVFAAESLRFPLTRGSTAIRRSFRVPAPRQHGAAFADALEAIVTREGIDLLIPTCEEIFHVAALRERLAARCQVLCDRPETLTRLHSKWEFMQLAQRLDLPTPTTRLLASPAELAAELDAPVALKPEYSRFAVATVLRHDASAPAPTIAPTASRRWVAQELLTGREFCSFGVARDGALLAHVVYPARYRAGPGSCVFFEPVEHPEITRWVERLVAGVGFTGQIAFDFMETERGPLPLECNPRLTSGVHLFADAERLADAYLGASSARVAPSLDRRMIAGAMLLFCLPLVRSWSELRAWARAFGEARDVIFSGRDPLTLLTQFLGLAELQWISWRAGVDLLSASTLDIEWNGE